MNSSAIDDTFSEEILSKIKEELNSGICQELITIWAELWDENERQERRKILADECQQEIRDFLQVVFVKEKKVRDKYIERIEELLNEMNELQKTLEIVIPYEDVENLPLHIMAARLNDKAQKYRVMRNKHVQKLNELVQKEAELCEKLGMVRQISNTSEVSTKAKFKVLENQIAAMEQEKVNRTVTFLEQRQAIIKLFEDTGIEPLLNFEKEIVSEKVIETFLLTNENMKKLDELREKMESQLEEAQKEVDELLDKLKLLWNYLDKPEEHKTEFLEKNKGCTVAIINAIKEELNQCETKKRENMSVIIERIRKVLVEEWDRCLIGKEEREKFRPFNINCFTEDLFDLHDLEIMRLKKFYRDNEQIFVLIGKHEKLFNKLLELEKGSKNANRYYNRGGQLLQEEKERKLITKELPIVEEELRSLLKKFEEDHKEPFTSFGVPVEMILDEQWNAHFDQKTIEKLARKKTEKKGKTPLGKRLCTTPYTPLSANKIPKLVPSNTKHVTPKLPPRTMTLRKKLDVESEAPTLEPTYEDFQTGLQSKVERSTKAKKPIPRSTAMNDVPGNVLRERNTPKHVPHVTPFKTAPGKLSPPMWSPSAMKTPKTLPKARRKSKIMKMTPSPAPCTFLFN